MAENITYQKAMVLLERAYRFQMRGELADAILLYEHSIDVHPTAEAWTYLGWTYSMLNRFDEAIECCQNAIEVDPSFGNPYNDIGAYMIDLGEFEAAVPWLEKATVAERYEYPHFAYTNLGRAYEGLRRFGTALSYYNEALELDPLYLPAVFAKRALLGKLN